MSLIIMEGNCGDIDDDYSTCHGYYIIRFYEYPYNLQANLSIHSQVVFSGKMVFDGTFLINIKNNYYFSSKGSSITQWCFEGKESMTRLMYNVMV